MNNKAAELGIDLGDPHVQKMLKLLEKEHIMEEAGLVVRALFIAS
jgi:hypothetical protein